MSIRIILSLWLLPLLVACGSAKTGKQEDELYSRHLQRKVKLTILNSPLPSDKTELNLLIVNDGQDLTALRCETVLDSLTKTGKLKPLLIVGIEAGDRMQEFGVSGQPDFQQRGKKAGQYEDFVVKELLPFIRKKAGTRSFRSTAIAGWSMGGLSAFDIAWSHPDKFDKAGIFSGSFWWRDKDAADSSYQDRRNRIMHNKVRNFRKARQQNYWFFCGSLEENSDRDKDGIIDVQDDIEDLRMILMEKGLLTKDQLPLVIDRLGRHELDTWRLQWPDFLLWAFGK